jgi:hypothetical protein
MKEIILTIDNEGRTSLQTKGFKGKSCMQASKFLEEALGNTTKNEFTPEYYEFDGVALKNSLTRFVNQK